MSTKALTVRETPEEIIWEAILDCAVRIRADKGASFYLLRTDVREITEILMPRIAGWRLIEILCVMTVFDQAEAIPSAVIRGITGVCGPHEFQKDGLRQFLWTQPKMNNGISGFAGIPDILITNSPAKPSPENTTTAIECKGVKNLNARSIRSEFAKMHDLGITAYVMWSYFNASPKVIAGALKLGIDLGEIGFGSVEGDARWTPVTLREHIGREIERARADRRLAAEAGSARQRAFDKPAGQPILR